MSLHKRELVNLLKINSKFIFYFKMYENIILVDPGLLRGKTWSPSGGLIAKFANFFPSMLPTSEKDFISTCRKHTLNYEVNRISQCTITVAYLTFVWWLFEKISLLQITKIVGKIKSKEFPRSWEKITWLCTVLVAHVKYFPTCVYPCACWFAGVWVEVRL